MTMASVSDPGISLSLFKAKISECLDMVGSLEPRERIQAVEIWNEISEQLQQVINNAMEELDLLEKEKTKIFNETNSNILSPRAKKNSSSSNYTSPIKIGVSLLKPPAEKREMLNVNISPTTNFKSLLVSGHSLLLDASSDPEHSENNSPAPDNGDQDHSVPFDPGVGDTAKAEEEDFHLANLSGQVLIVPENNDIAPESDIGAVDGIMTVTDEEGITHKVQFALEDDNENLDMDANSQEITPEMASVKTVNVNEMPGTVDETPNKVIRTKPDGGKETYFQCNFCDKEFSTAASLTSHRWQHTKPFQCESCKIRFASKGNLVIHRRRHTGDRPFACNLCDSKFTTKGNLKRHLQSHSGVKPYACTQCDGRFTEKKSLKIHMRKHTGERPYSCKYCQKSFAQASILKSHLAMHLDKRSYVCELCGKGFRQKSQLRLHEKRHSGQKTFECPYCESKFITKGDHERHIKSHLGQRDFHCTLCEKTFTRQQTLNEHMNRHYGVKPYECKACGQTFSEMSTVYKHLKTHSKKPQDELIIRKLSESHPNPILQEDVLDVLDIDPKLQNAGKYIVNPNNVIQIESQIFLEDDND